MSCLTFCACSKEPEWQPLPAQLNFQPDKEPLLLGMNFRTQDTHAENHILRGTLPESPGAQWRWTNPEAELRFQLAESKPASFYLDIVLADVVYRTTGPVPFHFWIGDHEFASEVVTGAGPHHLEYPVPVSLLTAALPLQVKVVADKYLVAEGDGVKLAYLLVGGGFKQ